MKYPKIQHKELDSFRKKEFDKFKLEFEGVIALDNNENQLGLSKKDIKLLAWNCAYMAICVNAL